MPEADQQRYHMLAFMHEVWCAGASDAALWGRKAGATQCSCLYSALRISPRSLAASTSVHTLCTDTAHIRNQ